MDIFVTAIGTDSGKTLVSAILTEALNSDYWKPVQAGMPRDTETVQSLVSNDKSRFWPEAYLLNTPASPHASAKIDQVEIELSKIHRPNTENHLIVEGAGGLMVPINDTDYVIDIPRNLKIPVVLVSNLYLGSINHTLLSIDHLIRNEIPVIGLVFNGPSNIESEGIISAKSPWPVLLKIEQEEEVNKEVVLKYSAQIKEKLF